MDRCLQVLHICIMDGRDVKPLKFDRLRLLGAPFIYENPKRWTWKSTLGNSYYNLWICRSGHANFRFSETGRRYEIRPWTALIIPPETPHHGWNEEDVADFKNFSAHWVPVSLGDSPPVFEPTVSVIKEIDTAESLIQGILRLSAYGDAFGRQQAEWLLISLLALIWREVQLPWDSPADEIILKQIGRIRGGESLFADVQELADEAHMSRVHYTRRFKRAVGLSPNEFLVRQRVERSAILLKQTDWTLEQIADVIGYADQHYFSRQFRRTMGVSPGAYRKQD